MGVYKRHVCGPYLERDIMDEIVKPFSMGYVLRTTAKHMRKSIDISIRKTFERMTEFQNDTEKSSEVFKTLAMLHTMRKQLDDFQNYHSENFKGE
jgi:hypothetical protein